MRDLYIMLAGALTGVAIFMAGFLACVWLGQR